MNVNNKLMVVFSLLGMYLSISFFPQCSWNSLVRFSCHTFPRMKWSTTWKSVNLYIYKSTEKERHFTQMMSFLPSAKPSSITRLLVMSEFETNGGIGAQVSGFNYTLDYQGLQAAQALIENLTMFACKLGH